MNIDSSKGWSPELRLCIVESQVPSTARITAGSPRALLGVVQSKKKERIFLDSIPPLPGRRTNVSQGLLLAVHSRTNVGRS